MSRRFAHTCIVPILISACAVTTACTGALDEEDNATSSESDVRVKPKGSTDGPPTVTLKLPNGVSESNLATLLDEDMQSQFAQRSGGSIDDKYYNFKFGVENEVEPGVVSVFTGLYHGNDTPKHIGTRTSSFRLEAQAGKSYEVGLTALSINHDRNDIYLGRSFSLRVGEEVRDNKYDLNFDFYGYRDKVVPFWNGLKDKWVALFPGPTTVRFGIMDGFTVDGKGGAKFTSSTGDFDGRQAVLVRTPVRELPNCGNIRYLIGPRTSAYGIDRHFEADSTSVADGSSLGVFGYNPAIWGPYDASTSPAQGTNAYSIAVYNNNEFYGHGVLLPVSDVGNPPVEFAIGRIDVDDVERTGPNGQVGTVRGKYSVYSDKGILVVKECDTNSGVDVPPGKYKVVVSYDAVGGSKTSDYVVDVP